MTDSSPRVLVFLAAGAEEMEVTITVDVLRRAGVEVVLAGLEGRDPVVCSRGLRLVPDLALAEVSGDFDAIVLPGGAGGTEAMAGSVAVGDLLRRQWAAGRLVAAICAAPHALVQHRVAAGVPMTSHPSVATAVSAHGDYREEAVVDTPALITSRGPGTSFEFALTVAARLVGRQAASALRGPMMLPEA